ncbi:hypothetical protein O181_030713 [Austropuccinia psidii MF-1]|uniref:S-formylglutathione hydrolase n=1 Tax=Austropuccinia psidii MF-1 TaxID=1389203 RepID=A0A9Q3CW12_9BASI|nr:hypothetical protein [Austropuccinia psidii MF-1]
MSSDPRQVAINKSHDGNLIKYQFVSSALGGLETRFNLFLPPTVPGKDFPVLYYLAGLTCTEDTGAQKGGFFMEAVHHGIALVFPDTSPRGANINGEEDSWDFGTGAGFYLNATHPKWKKHYQMERLIIEELPQVLRKLSQPLDTSRQSIFGHSMGGHGALTLYLNHLDKFQSCSAFAPIANPVKCPWGKKAFSGPNGNDGYLAQGIEEGKKYDATLLIADADPQKVHILVDYGSSDQFYKDSQLLPENFSQVVELRPELQVKVRQQDGYDHSYYFISTFAADHIKFHAQFLN